MIKEGYIPFHGYQTWYRIVLPTENSSKGDSPKKIPLLVLHGGPGSAHDYLESLDDIALMGRTVIYYDQLGCGKSVVPSNPEMWNVNLWQQEIDVVRQALKLDEVHILGQSWGGMLAMQYAITLPEGIKSMVVSSSPASMKLWQQEAKRLIRLLSPKDQEAIEKAEKSNQYDTPEFQAAMAEYDRRHVCSILPKPEFVQRSNEQTGEVYAVMEGPSEFSVTGKLRDWDITEDLHKIKIPTLLTSGTDDEATPYIMKQILDQIPDCRWELLQGTHLVHVEQREAFNQIVNQFLEEHDL